jgi:predicted ATPase
MAELHLLPSPDPAPPLDVSPQRKKDKTLEALLRQVERLARQQPVLMAFEDIHWIDPSSRELLDRTMQRIANWPVLLVATFRPEFQPPWTGQPYVTMLALTRLDRRDAAEMVANIAGSAALPTEIVQEIAERADGVPLFVEELTKAVVESGTHGVTALSSVPHPALSVPATLQASLMARLDRLGPVAKEVAQKGAVIGREFGYELLASIADLPEMELRKALGRLTNSGLVFARGAPQQPTFLFKHALVQDAAYGTLLRSRRAAAPFPHRRRPRAGIPYPRSGAARSARSTLRASRPDGEGDRLLAWRRTKGAGGRSRDGSSGESAERSRSGRRTAGERGAPGTGTSSPDRLRPKHSSRRRAIPHRQ